MKFNLFNFFKRKKKISLLNDKWEILIPLLEVDEIPRINEYIWLEDYKNYFRVMTIAHNIQKKQGIFIILENNSIEDEKKLQIT